MQSLSRQSTAVSRVGTSLCACRCVEAGAASPVQMASAMRLLLAHRHRAYSSSPASEHGSSTQPDTRSQLLAEAIKYIPEQGFSIRALERAVKDVPRLAASLSSSSSSTTSMFIEQLFPSLPVRSRSSSASHQDQGRERIGPARALFEAWTEDARERLRDSLATGSSASSSSGAASAQRTAPPPLSAEQRKQDIKRALETRLSLNLPVLPYLPDALATLASRDAGTTIHLSLLAYLRHVRSVAYTIKDLTRAETSLFSLASAYALAEAYQISPSRPDFHKVKDYVDVLLERTEAVDGALRDTRQFAGYVVDSWRSIYKARGL